MKNLSFLTVILFSIVLFTGCSKTNSTPPPAPQTNFQVNVQDNLGNAVAGATVYLYADSADFFNGTNVLASTVSGNNGAALFMNVSPLKYYFLVKSGCENNVNSGNVLTNTITANVTTTVTAVISSTGTLKFVNTSANPYTIYVNGVAIGTLPGNTQYSYNYAPTMAYSLRVLQNSGYLVTPTDETFTGTLSCGVTLTTTFP